MFLQSENTQARDLNRSLSNVNGSRQGERTNPSVTALELGEAFPLGFEFAPAEEVLVGRIQVSQGFLRSTLGDFVEPGKTALSLGNLLEGVEFLVEVNGRG